MLASPHLKHKFPIIIYGYILKDKTVFITKCIMQDSGRFTANLHIISGPFLMNINVKKEDKYAMETVLLAYPFTSL